MKSDFQNNKKVTSNRPESPDGGKLNRYSHFSYTCHKCLHCCHYKRIQVNPYEVARLARNLKLTTTDVIEQYLEAEQPYLKTNPEDGACVFLTESGCGVHKDRPLVCRLYPLGQIVGGDDREEFILLNPHPQSKGVFGRQGTVAGFLDEQETAPFFAARNQYRQLLFRLLDILSTEVETDIEAYDITAEAFFNHEQAQEVLSAWFDMDKTLEQWGRQAATTGINDLVKRVELHIEIMKERLLEQEKGGNYETNPSHQA